MNERHKMRLTRLTKAGPAIAFAAASLLVITLPAAAQETATQMSMKMSMSAASVIADWPATPKEVAQKTIEKYGEPDGVTKDMLVWTGNGPWKKTSVSREEIPHDFPVKHTDLMKQEIDYRVPADKFDDLARYDGSVIVERTKGTIAARCDKEEANFLALNLAHDIVTGKKTAEQAREAYAKDVKASMMGEKPAYMQKLQFSVPKGNTADADRSVLDKGMMKAMKEKEMMKKGNSGQ